MSVIVNRKGPVFDSGLCRCCGSSKKCRLLNYEYYYQGQKEIYSELFVDVFGLVLSSLDGEEADRLICATCVSRLRDAKEFRQQVLLCEQRLLNDRIQVHSSEPDDSRSQVAIKLELQSPNECWNPNYHEDNDDVPTDLLCNESQEQACEEQQNKNETKVENAAQRKSIRTRRTRVRNPADKADATKLRSSQRVRGVQRLKNKADSSDTAPNKIEERVSQTSRRVIDTDEKSTRNTVTIVENSFVCPFDTSFSDYFCVYCRETFTDPDKLREHTATHDPNNFHEQLAGVLRHKKHIQIDVTRVDCRLCSARIETVEDLKSHLKTHGKKIYTEIANEFLKFRLTANNLTCLECGNAFRFFHALRKHMAEHFGTCICDICGAHYFEERMLYIHQKTHVKKYDENYPCLECGKCFKSKHSRGIHVMTIHKKEPTYQCSKCDAVLFSYSLRHRHMIEVHGEQRTYQCEHCDRAYDSRKSLREHNRRNHLKVFRHQCDLCDKRFYLPSRLREHMVVHTGERNFRCELCGKSYPRLRGLKVHMQSHDTDKKFRCDVCEATFTQNMNLRNHMKRQHQSTDIDTELRIS